jgi:ATP-dependent RNA helicase DDX1
LYPAVCLKNAEVGVTFGGATDAAFAHAREGFVGVGAAGKDVLEWGGGGGGGEGEGEGGGGGGGGGGDGGDERKRNQTAKNAARAPTAIVLEPARDLAEQTHEFFRAFASQFRNPAIETALCVGGVDIGPQQRALRDGVDVVVGTPGRVIDLVERGALRVSSARFFVLDEADRLLDTGNRDAIVKLFKKLPKSGPGFARLQVLLFSATLHSPEIASLRFVLRPPLGFNPDTPRRLTTPLLTPLNSTPTFVASNRTTRDPQRRLVRESDVG